MQNTVLTVQKRFKKKITWKNFRLLHSILVLETQFDWRVWNFCSYRLHLKLYSCFLNWSIKYNKQRYLIMHDYNGPDVNIPFTMTIYLLTLCIVIMMCTRKYTSKYIIILQLHELNWPYWLVYHFNTNRCMWIFLQCYDINH